VRVDDQQRIGQDSEGDVPNNQDAPRTESVSKRRSICICVWSAQRYETPHEMVMWGE
jgi:hypothetical protein